MADWSSENRHIIENLHSELCDLLNQAKDKFVDRQNIRAAIVIRNVADEDCDILVGDCTMDDIREVMKMEDAEGTMVVGESSHSQA